MSGHDPKQLYRNPNFIGDDGGSEVWGNDHGFKDIELYAVESTKEGAAETVSMDFNDMLPLIGEFGRYQKLLFVLMIPFGYYLAFVYFTQIFLTLVPEQHWCSVPELQGLTEEQRSVWQRRVA